MEGVDYLGSDLFVDFGSSQTGVSVDGSKITLRSSNDLLM